MKAIHKRWLVPVLILLLGAFAAGSEAAENFFDLFNLTESIDGYYTMKDLKDGSPVLRTARILHVGDEFIDEQNRHFRVVKLEEKTAWAEQVESSRSPAGDAQAPLAYAAAGDEKKKPSIGIYHTHGAESYVPTDGTETIDQGGGILKVGDTLARALEEKGFDVNHVREPHTPHDAGAYQRSRRTAKKLLAQGDDIIFDVHRDAVPPEEYEEEVEGEEVTKILLVVGQQNQNAANNRDFALKLKEIADREHPGLIKGILGAQGNYNQDLTSQGILLEVGAHENRREEAERAVALFADVVEIYVTGPAASPDDAAQSSRLSLSSVLKVILLLAAALLAYLLIASGSLAEFKRKISSFFQREFADLRNFSRRDRGGRKDE
ncbi:MAG: stage II sporulation protein P [Firmicutes bacterium]|jgi:stage II sporulation protein P|nr:stage II sporulation protein P [Bacillota bacterium]HPU00327.1 stage II sporulation protein P [Bacillota bacterium]